MIANDGSEKPVQIKKDESLYIDMISKKMPERKESFSRKGTKYSEDIHDYFGQQLIDEPSRNDKKMSTMIVDLQNDYLNSEHREKTKSSGVESKDYIKKNIDYLQTQQ